MMFFHTLPVELFFNILLNLSPGDIVSFLDAMDLDIRFINRLSFYRPYCQIKLDYFFRDSSIIPNTFDILVGRYSSKKNFYRKLFMIIVEAHRAPEDVFESSTGDGFFSYSLDGFYSSIEIENGWIVGSNHSYRIMNIIIEKMIKTFVYREDRHNISAVKWSHAWEVSMWPKSGIFPLTFSLLVHYPRIFQNQGKEGSDMIFKCYTYGITFSMIQNRILALAASGEEQTFDTVFSNELFND
jgi:hypothetical protein